MYRLWAPWRLAYVTEAGSGRDSPCVFCAAQSESGLSPLVLHHGEHCFVILNKYPYSNGHLMVVPTRHVGSLSDATSAELTELMALTKTAEIVLKQAYQPHGLNVGMNLGKPAGAGVLDHLHIHVVPRWNGDTNFMTVTAETRVVPEEPSQTVERLRPLFTRFA